MPQLIFASFLISYQTGGQDIFFSYWKHAD